VHEESAFLCHERGEENNIVADVEGVLERPCVAAGGPGALAPGFLHYGPANPGARSMPLLAQISDMTRPAKQNIVSTFHVMWTFDAVVERRERASNNSAMCNLSA